MAPRERSGLDVLLANGHAAINGKRIGLITNHTAVDQLLNSAIDLLHADPRFDLVRLFGPEHGVRGAAQAGDHIADEHDAATGLPVVSLYGANRRPTAEQLADIDVLVFDIQDAGARHYTYMSTMAEGLRAAAEHGKPFVVLDRPNPITGLHAEGSVLDPAFTSFVGILPIPTRHALTMGEIALMVARHDGIADPIVIPCDGWERHMWWADTGMPFVLPSPNLPTPDSLLIYPGTCIFEATNCSEGRGTTRPFEFIGAPWLDGLALAQELNGRDLPGVRFRATSFVPTFSKHKGVTCHGVQVHVMDRHDLRPVATGIHVLHAIHATDPESFAWRAGSAPGMSAGRLCGKADLEPMIDAGASPEDIIATWHEPLAEFHEIAREFALYL